VSVLYRLFAVAMATSIATSAAAAPPTPERVLELCAQVDGPSHCGRLVEEEQLKTLPNLAVRDGATLRVALFPSGTRDFVDDEGAVSGRTFALWDYWSPINAVVLFTTEGERLGYALLQRATGALTVLPAEPVLAPDRQRVAIADFCSRSCNNDISVWRVTRDGVQRELAWKPGAAWSDVNVTWKDSDVLLIQYSVAGDDVTRKLERKLAEPGWQRF
jgi:hypothetical protein